MGTIDFGETQAEHNAAVENFLNDLKVDLYGNGREGLKQRATTFMDRFEAIENERKEQHKASTARLNIIIGLLLAIAAYIAIVVSIRGLPKTSDVFHSQDEQQWSYDPNR